MPVRGQGVVRWVLASSAGLLALQAYAGSGASATAGAATSGLRSSANVGAAMDWLHKIDQLTTLLDHAQKLAKYGPYSTKQATDTSKDSHPPAGGSASVRTCSYPAGYPRVGIPALADAMGTTAPIKSLIIKEIPSHADAPAAPDLSKWTRDSMQRGLSVEAGPVFGAYLVQLPRAVSELEAVGIIRQMYMADMLDTGSTPGCRYDYIVPNLPMKALTDTNPPPGGPTFPPPDAPQIATSAFGTTMLDTDFNEHNKIMGPISEITAHDLWPLLGAWANTPGDKGQPPHRLATTAVAVIDPTFDSGSDLSRPIPMTYQGPIERITKKGQPADPVLCQATDKVVAAECHGDIVAAVLGQNVSQSAQSDGNTVLAGGSLGRGLFYRGAPGDPTTANPLYGNPDPFPIERIESGSDLFTLASALAYAAGRPMGYREVDGVPSLTDQVLDGTSDTPLTGVRQVKPLSPAPRVIDVSLGDYILAPSEEESPALCNTPFMRDAIKLMHQKGIIAVAPSGNVDDDYRDLLFQQQDRGGRIVVVPAACDGFYEVGGMTVSDHGATEIAVNADGGIEPSRKDAYWEPFSTHIVTTSDPFGHHREMLAVSGTSVAAPRFAGTIAMMLAIDPALDPVQVDQLLKSKAVTFPGTPPLRVVPSFSVWSKVIRMGMAADLAALNPATGLATGGK